MNSKQKSWFASLSKTKLLCSECKELKKVSKHIRDGWVKLECSHERNVKEINSDTQKEKEVVSKLDHGEEPSEFRKIGDVIWDWPREEWPEEEQ